MTQPPDAGAFYLDAAGEPFLCRLDAAQGEDSGHAVLLVPPFGWEEICSYRPRMFWARHLAARGTPVLRPDLPGGGDSAGGPWDRDRLGAWTAAVEAAAAWLAHETGGTRRVTLVGLGMGGLVGWRAVARGAPIDDLVLWGAQARGRSLVREVKAFARLERSRLLELNPGRELPEDDDGALTAAGFTLAPETIAALGAVDLATLPLPDAAGRRVLILGRDGAAPDARLAEAAAAAGAAVATAAGVGWGAMVDAPQDSAPPWPSIADVDAWLAERAAGARPRALAAPVGAVPRAAEHAVMPGPDGPVRESPLRVGGIDGIVTEPLSGAAPALTLLLLNAGSIRRVGPNRMWVELARRWAARGVACVRVDLPGIGEADGAETFGEDAGFYQPRYVDAVRAVLDAVQRRQGARRFGALGLCSGAHWALHAAAADDRVDAAYALNPRALVWEPGLAARRDTRKVGHLARASTYRRVLRGDIRLRRGSEIAGAIARRALRGLAALPGRLAGRTRRDGAAPAADPLDALLDGLRDAGKRPYLLFTGGEPVHEELARSGRLDRAERWPNLLVECLDELRDVHTLQPRALQRNVHERVDAAIARDLERARAGSAAARGAVSP